MLDNALVNHKYRLIFFWNGKCACTTMKKFFIKTVEDKNGDNLSERELHTYIMRYYLKNEINKNRILNGYKKIIVVRNPYSRLVSFFTNKCIVNKDKIIIDKRKQPINPKQYSFFDIITIILNTPKQYLEHHIAPQITELEDIKFNNIIKMENLEDEMKMVLLENDILIQFDFKIKVGGHDTKYNDTESTKSLFIKANKFDKNNIPTYKWFYNTNISKKIAEYYHDDFIRFNYSKIL